MIESITRSPVIRSTRGSDRGATRPCVDQDPEVFFPTISGAAIEYAKAIYRPCPIRVSCLRLALERNEQGVWGGTSDAERRVVLSGGADDPVGVALLLADAGQVTDQGLPAHRDILNPRASRRRRPRR